MRWRQGKVRIPAIRAAVCPVSAPVANLSLNPVIILPLISPAVLPLLPLVRPSYGPLFPPRKARNPKELRGCMEMDEKRGAESLSEEPPPVEPPLPEPAGDAPAAPHA